MATLTKRVRADLEELQLADEMIRLGARLQPIKDLTTLSYDRISLLYREIIGASPPKGMLPYSLDWYITWKANIHSSLFFWIYQCVKSHMRSPNGDALERTQEARLLIDAYYLYQEHIQAATKTGLYQEEPELTFTRAWMLLRFLASDQITTAECQSCHGHFLIRADDHGKNYTCGVCNPPPRAGIASR